MLSAAINVETNTQCGLYKLAMWASKLSHGLTAQLISGIMFVGFCLRQVPSLTGIEIQNKNKLNIVVLRKRWIEMHNAAFESKTQ